MSLYSVIDGFLGATLVYAALSKAATAGAFSASLARIRVIRPVASPVALTVILAEALVGVSLISGFALSPGRLAAAALFGAFGVTLAGAWLAGLDLECACFGGEAHKVETMMVARDLVFASLAIYDATAPNPVHLFPLMLLGVALAAGSALLAVTVRALRPMEVCR